MPGSYELIVGSLAKESAYVFEDEALRAEAERWFSVLPGIVLDDTQTWSVAVGSASRQRHVRLILTHVKPTVRSTLALSGVVPTVAFAANWVELAEFMDSRDTESAAFFAICASCSLPRVMRKRFALANTAYGCFGGCQPIFGCAERSSLGRRSCPAEQLRPPLTRS